MSRRQRACLTQAIGTGEALSPLDYLLLVMRSPEFSPQERLHAARGAAPYCHSRHATIDVNASVRGQYWISDRPLSADEWAAEFATEKPDDAQVPVVPAAQRLELEIRDECAQ
jgi:hypothetical protein